MNEPKASPRDFMVGDKWDRCDLAGVRWLLFTPGLQSDMRTATDEQILDYAGDAGEDFAFANSVRQAEPGDWIAFKYGVAVRLRKQIEVIG